MAPVQAGLHSPMHKKTGHGVDKIGFGAGVPVFLCTGIAMNIRCICAQELHELPPEVPTIGVTARYLVEVFPAQRLGFPENVPKRWKILVFHLLGTFLETQTVGRPHCSIVDTLNENCKGRVTHFVSSCWKELTGMLLGPSNIPVNSFYWSERHRFKWVCTLQCINLERMPKTFFFRHVSSSATTKSPRK